MSRVTKLMKLRRRKGSTHWCPTPRTRWRFHFGVGTVFLITNDGTVTEIGVMRDVSLDSDIWGNSCHSLILDDPLTMRSGDTLDVSYTLTAKRDE